MIIFLLLVGNIHLTIILMPVSNIHTIIVFILPVGNIYTVTIFLLLVSNIHIIIILAPIDNIHILIYSHARRQYLHNNLSHDTQQYEIQIMFIVFQHYRNLNNYRSKGETFTLNFYYIYSRKVGSHSECFSYIPIEYPKSVLKSLRPIHHIY